MLVEKHKSTAEATEGFASQSRTYSVDSPALVFDVLCNKMYSNPLSTMVQEYLANARDANVEAGCSDVPVRVVLPNDLDPHLYIKDSGPGLTEQRIDTVFTRLGASTKDQDDTLLGGYGLGAKIGWAYGDSFSVISVVDGVQSTYLAYLGDDGVGRMDTLSVDTVDERNGVTIKIFIKPSDRRELVDIIERVTYFWDVSPVCTSYVFESHGKPVNTMVLYIKTPFSSHGNIYAVVGGVPYFVNKSLIPKTSSLRMPGNSSALFLFFDVGEVDVAINREGLRYSPKTIDNITHSIQSVADMNSDSVKDAVALPLFSDKVSALRDCYKLIGAPSEVLVPINPLLFLRFTYFEHGGTLLVMRAVGTSASMYVVSKTGKLREDIQVKHSTYADAMREAYLTEGAYKSADIRGISVPLSPDASNAPHYVCLLSGDDFAATHRARCRTAVNRPDIYGNVRVLALHSKATYDFLVGVLGYKSLHYVEETFPEKVKRDNSNRACNFVDTDVKDIYSRTRTIHIDALIASPENTMWCTFKECGEVRKFIQRVKYALPQFFKVQCYYLTQPQVTYLTSHESAPPHYKEKYKQVLHAAPMLMHHAIEKNFSAVDTIDALLDTLSTYNVFRRNTLMTAVKDNLSLFNEGHIVYKFLKSYATVAIFESHAVSDAYEDLKRYSELLKVTHNRKCRMYTYYLKRRDQVYAAHNKLFREFNDVYPLLYIMSTSFHATSTKGVHIVKHLIKYLQNACS